MEEEVQSHGSSKSTTQGKAREAMGAARARRGRRGQGKEERKARLGGAEWQGTHGGRGKSREDGQVTVGNKEDAGRLNGQQRAIGEDAQANPWQGGEAKEEATQWVREKDVIENQTSNNS
eukprot:Gb_07230 [translate_table: standard]